MKASDIQAITKAVTKKWTKQRKAEERNSTRRSYRSEYMYSDRVNQTDVAFQVIPEAYAKASDNGRLPAHARQIFYAARKEIQDRTGRPLQSVYFTQALLPKFINANQELTAGWWVVYDARGHLIEPHTDETIPLGTLAVDKYLRSVSSRKIGDEDDEPAKGFELRYPTKGPTNRFSAVLFIEKEGFNPLFEEVKLAERFDLAIMSTKGQSVVAARRLVDELCHIGAKVPVLVLHDLDKEGFLISQNLTSVSRSARWNERVRYEFTNTIEFIDLGLRLKDVEAWNLESESVGFKGSFERDSITTPAEREFLKSGQRVELNAFTSADFIAWIEGKLEQHGIKKVVPDAETLKHAFRRAYRISDLNRQIEEAHEEAADRAEEAKIPRGIRKQVTDALAENPEEAWDDVVARIAEERLELGSGENGSPNGKSKKAGLRKQK